MKVSRAKAVGFALVGALVLGSLVSSHRPSANRVIAGGGILQWIQAQAQIMTSAPNLVVTFVQGYGRQGFEDPGRLVSDFKARMKSLMARADAGGKIPVLVVGKYLDSNWDLLAKHVPRDVKVIREVNARGGGNDMPVPFVELATQGADVECVDFGGSFGVFNNSLQFLSEASKQQDDVGRKGGKISFVAELGVNPFEQDSSGQGQNFRATEMLALYLTHKPMVGGAELTFGLPGGEHMGLGELKRTDYYASLLDEALEYARRGDDKESKRVPDLENLLLVSEGGGFKSVDAEGLPERHELIDGLLGVRCAGMLSAAVVE